MLARRRILLASLLALTSARGPTTATGGALTLTVDPRTGAYAFGGTIALAGGATSLRADGRLLSTADGSLALDGAPAALQGTDAALGPFTGYEMTYNSRLMVTRIKAFAAQCFVFEQLFPRGVNGTAAHPGGNATEDSYALSSAFPALVLPPAPGPGGYAVFDYFALRGGGAGAPFNATRPLRILRGTALPDAPADALPLRYFVAAPVLRSGWVLVGEAAKFVTMAGARMRNFAETGAGFSVDVAALGAEDIDVLVVPPGRARPVAVACGTTAARPVRTLACSGAAACACA